MHDSSKIKKNLLYIVSRKVLYVYPRAYAWWNNWLVSLERKQINILLKTKYRQLNKRHLIARRFLFQPRHILFNSTYKWRHWWVNAKLQHHNRQEKNIPKLRTSLNNTRYATCSSNSFESAGISSSEQAEVMS